MRPILLLMLYCFFASPAFAQVALSTNGAVADANTMLDVKSNNKGVKFPRLTSAERKGMTVNNTDAGLMVFDTDKQCLYMYNGNGWMPFAYAEPGSVITKVIPPAGNFQAYRYGDAVDVDGDFAVVSAPWDTTAGGTQTGSVFMYKKINGTWTFQSRLQAPVPAGGDQFGCSVSISGNYLVVGAAYHDLTYDAQGAAYIYFYNGSNWQFQQKLIPADPAVMAYFGREVAIQGSTVVVSATNLAVGANSGQGAAYIFTRTGITWAQQQKLLAPDGTYGAQFGTGLAIDGDYIVVGAPDAQTAGVTKGGAYVFVKGGGTWTFQQKLVGGASPNSNSNFGCSVAIEGNQLMVGAYTDYVNANTPGVVHFFTRSGSVWTHIRRIYSSDNPQSNQFGLKLKFRNGYAIISAPQQFTGLLRTGRVYLFKHDVAQTRFVRFLDPQNQGTTDHWATAVGFDGDDFLFSSSNSIRYPEFGPEIGVVYFGSLDQ